MPTPATRSAIYVSHALAPLAARLAVDACGQAHEHRRDPMVAATIVVPSRNVRRWVQLYLARHTGIAINLKFQYLEAALWDVLASLDPSGERPQRFDQQVLQSMVLSLFLREERPGGDLATLVDYLPPRLDDQKRVRRDFLRQAWQLAGRLADHLRNYEYHRPALIEAWRRGSGAFYDSSGKDLEPLRRMEAAQRALYSAVLGPGGLRDGFTRREGALLTLGEYARRVFAGVRPGTSGNAPLPPFHVFALSEPSALHADLLHRLAEVVPVHLYLLTPRAAEVDSAPALLARVTTAAESSGPASVAELTRLWGEADARLVRRLGPLLMDRGRFTFQVLADEVATTQAKRMTPAAPRTQRSVLTAVQDGLVRREPGRPRRQRQDASLQIVGCPSIQRELEAVHEGILHNLRADPSLRPTDFAVLVPDLARYRAAVHDVFERGRDRLPYNLTDVSASDASAFGQALLTLLDLATGRFSRTEVCGMLSDPCFLTAAGVDRLTAAKWVHWAHALNICHAFDRSDKRARGYPDNGLYTWQQALQRLRLGRVLDCGNGQAEDGDLPDYQGIVPYCDLDSGDADVLGRFCWTVETLYRRLQRLKDLSATAGRWRDEIRGMLPELLAVPEDRPEEQEVRNGLLAYLDRWVDVGPWEAGPGGNGSQSGAPTQRLQLPVVREVVRQGLAGIDGNFGACLVGGVTVGSLQRMVPLPFEVIYIVGLGEGDFPGRQVPSTLDLRALDGGPEQLDVSAPDANRLLFLQALLAARRKLYLSYVSRDLQKDQVLYPCSLLNQLRRVLTRDVIDGDGSRGFEVQQVPLDASDPSYLHDPPPWGDATVNSLASERLLCVVDAAATGRLTFSNAQRSDVACRERAARVDGRVTAAAAENATGGTNGRAPRPVRVRELKGLLREPLDAALKRHLGLYDADEPPPREDDEPFYTVFPADWRFATGAARRFVKRATAEGTANALAAFDSDFDRHYDTCRLCNETPDGAFDGVDRDRLRRQARSLLDNGIIELADARKGAEFYGAVVVGPGQARCGKLPAARFPAMELPGGVQLHGQLPLMWRTNDAVEALVITTGNAKAGELTHHLLEPFLFLAALRAGERVNEVGTSSAHWVGGRALRVHMAHGGGLWTAEYAIATDQATAYLSGLASDLLDPASFDLLPFDVIQKGRRLSEAYKADGEDRELREAYPRLLTDAVEEALEDDYSQYRPPELLGLIEAEVPSDAYDKVRRRLRPVCMFSQGVTS